MKEEGSDVPTATTTSANALSEGKNIQNDDKSSEVIEAVEACATRQLMYDTLDTYYVSLEVWYTRTIIDKVCFNI